jgi:hypothetical protein
LLGNRGGAASLDARAPVEPSPVQPARFYDRMNLRTMKLSTSLEDINYVIGEVNGKLSILIEQMCIRDKRDEDVHTAFDRRLRIVEQRIWWAIGMGTTFGGLITFGVELWKK